MSDKNVTRIYAIFHLNLAFSSVDVASHNDIIQRCYWPLLNIIETHNIPLGIELTAYTLECIHKLDEKWVSTFQRLLKEKRCELLASGDSQIIGPLVPYEVNVKNFQLGQRSYHEYLNIEPKIAYVNEQAISSGLLDIYLDCGFECVVVEWDNPFSHNPDWSDTLLNRPQTLTTAKERSIKVIWNNAIAFQKFQRYAHGEIVLEDYLNYLQTSSKETLCFSLYGSDAEVFDYRPGRYTSETFQSNEEWLRLSSLMTTLQDSQNFRWVLPSECLEFWENAAPLNVTNSTHPISVKKQAKYNVTRWGISGRNDLVLNSLCYKKFYDLSKRASNDDEWRALCRLWASDLRTHLTESRYLELKPSLTPSVYHNIQHTTLLENEDVSSKYDIEHNEHTHQLRIRSSSIELVLNTFRGLAITSLAFQEHDFSPVCGTLAHGHFQHIRYGADFYSNHLVMERYKERDRVADLNKSSFKIAESNNTLVIQSRIPTGNGYLLKRYSLEANTLRCDFAFEETLRPEASLRLGFITLLNDYDRPWFSCYNGGDTPETFFVTDDIDHGAPVSSIVSASTSLGATTGELLFGSGNRGVRLTWNPANCAALPMISSKKVSGEKKSKEKMLNRCWFSLIEADETLKEGGLLPSFSYAIQAIRSPNDII